MLKTPFKIDEEVNRMIRNIIHKLTVSPKLLFLIDSLGAFLTSFFLFILSRNFHEYLGIPTRIFTCLSVIAACFCIYSMACFLFLKENWTPFISIISTANLIYCILTIGFLIYYFNQIKNLELTYFLTEITIIFALVYIEINVAKKLKSNHA